MIRQTKVGMQVESATPTSVGTAVDWPKSNNKEMSSEVSKQVDSATTGQVVAVNWPGRDGKLPADAKGIFRFG